MNCQVIRSLRAQWHQKLQEANELWTERDLAGAEKSFRKAFNIAKKVSRKAGKPDISVDITLKSMSEFYNSHGNYYSFALYFALTKFWQAECWFKKTFGRGARGARGRS